MSKILRVIKTEQIISRFYGSQRNLRSHYETLRVPPDASQRDIKLAFIKLSKEMHPDLSKKTNHTDFVKINEAYNVLSKKRTRQRYDMDLKFQGGSDGRPIRVRVYYESEPIPRPAPEMRDPNDPSQQCYYGIKGLKHVSNVTIALLCLILSAFGLSIQVLVVSKSVATRRDVADRNEESFKKLQTQVSSLDRDQQIAALEQRLAAKDLGVKYQSLHD